MIALTIIGFLIIAIVNFLSSKFGVISYKNGDKDILFPFSTMVFLFFSLLIYLPQVHTKLTNIQQLRQNNQKKINQDELFPVAFLFVLLSLTLAVIIDKFLLNKIDENKSDDQNKLYSESSTQSDDGQFITIKYFLTLSIVFVNISDAYFITLNHNKNDSLLAELFVMAIFNVVINFSYGMKFVYRLLGYLLGWMKIDDVMMKKLLIFMNLGLGVGLLIGLVAKATVVISILPCIAVAFSLYSSAFLCLPKIFTNGQKPVQDKFRYWAIFTSLLLTVLYYPIIYLLKI